VEQSTVPGEKTSPTQPFPTKPPAYDRQGSSIDDLIDFTPELRAEAVKLAARYKMGPIFTPPVVGKNEGPLATLAMATFSGGTNWPGGSYDPETHILYVFSQRLMNGIGLVVPDTSRSDMAFGLGKPPDVTGAPSQLFVQSLPMIKPPYGQISAIDMNKGEILWQIAHGETPDNVRNHPALKGLTIPRTGRAGVIGTLVTGSLLIAGESGMFTTPAGTRGAMLRAYDKATGKEMGAVPMPAGQTGSPMTYLLGGKQYIVVAIGGAGVPAELIAFKLPN
jgi:quinoprotein glucose dehydrogenase